jgi:hypothetical protein
VSDSLPQADALEVGRLVVACGALEGAMYDAIWRLYGLDPEDGLALTGRLSAKGRTDILRSLAHRYMRRAASRDAFAALLETIEAQFVERDYVVHTDWSVLSWGGPSSLQRGPDGVRRAPFLPDWMAALTVNVRLSRAQFLEAVALMAEVRVAERGPPPS